MCGNDIIHVLRDFTDGNAWRRLPYLLAKETTSKLPHQTVGVANLIVLLKFQLR